MVLRQKFCLRTKIFQNSFRFMVTLSDLSARYRKSAVGKALVRVLSEQRGKNVFLKGLSASSASMLFGGVLEETGRSCVLFILDDQESAAYFYHDMVQIKGDTSVLFFPSAYRRAAKYGQKDDASEILRTEVLSRLSLQDKAGTLLSVVTSPDALAEMVVSKNSLEELSLTLTSGESADREQIQDRLYELGFERVDYVYEPGQYAVRGSILDVFSFSSEYPYRVDFFGDDIDSIRQFSVETQSPRTCDTSSKFLWNRGCGVISKVRDVSFETAEMFSPNSIVWKATILLMKPSRPIIKGSTTS